MKCKWVYVPNIGIEFPKEMIQVCIFVLSAEPRAILKLF